MHPDIWASLRANRRHSPSPGRAGSLASSCAGLAGLATGVLMPDGGGSPVSKIPTVSLMRASTATSARTSFSDAPGSASQFGARTAGTLQLPRPGRAPSANWSSCKTGIAALRAPSAELVAGRVLLPPSPPPSLPQPPPCPRALLALADTPAVAALLARLEGDAAAALAGAGVEGDTAAAARLAAVAVVLASVARVRPGDDVAMGHASEVAAAAMAAAKSKIGRHALAGGEQ